MIPVYDFIQWAGIFILAMSLIGIILEFIKD
jgi:hypothetical protein